MVLGLQGNQSFNEIIYKRKTIRNNWPEDLMNEINYCTCNY